MTIHTHRATLSKKFISILDDLAVELYNKKHSVCFCMDCGYNTLLSNHDYYMVRDRVWDAHVETTEGMLCVSCLEWRMGRNLVFEDFTDCPLNRRHNLLYKKLLIKKYSRNTPIGLSDKFIAEIEF